MEYLIFWEMSRDITSIVSILFLFTWCLRYSILCNLTTRRPTTHGSHIWSRRKVFWRHARVSRATFIAHALKSRYNDNCKFSDMRRIDYNSLKPPQQGEDHNSQDVYQVYSSNESGNAFYSYGLTLLTVPFILFSLLTVFTFWILVLYKEKKWHGFTSIEFENSSVQEDPTIYANNSLLLGIGPEFSSDIAGDGPGYSDRELSDNCSSIEDFDSGSTEGSESSYDPIKDKKLE